MTNTIKTKLFTGFHQTLTIEQRNNPLIQPINYNCHSIAHDTVQLLAMNPTYSTIEPSSTTNRTIPKSNSDEEALIDASHQSILRATNNLYQSQNTMSPRLPRKRNVANNPNMAKEVTIRNNSY